MESDAAINLLIRILIVPTILFASAFLIYYFGPLRKLVQLYRVRGVPGGAASMYMDTVKVGRFPSFRTTGASIGIFEDGLYIWMTPICLFVPKMVIPWNSISRVKRLGSRTIGPCQLYIGKPTITVIEITNKTFQKTRVFLDKPLED